MRYDCATHDYGVIFAVESFPPGELLSELPAAKRDQLGLIIKRLCAVLSVLELAHKADLCHGALSLEDVLIEGAETGDEKIYLLGLSLPALARKLGASPGQLACPLEKSPSVADDLYSVAAIGVVMIGGREAWEYFNKAGKLPKTIAKHALGRAPSCGPRSQQKRGAQERG